MDVHIADAQGTLALVALLCEAGNKVVSGHEGARVEHKAAGANMGRAGEGEYVVRMR